MRSYVRYFGCRLKAPFCVACVTAALALAVPVLAQFPDLGPSGVVPAGAVNPAPEPVSLLLAGIGLGAVAAARKLTRR